jgi:cytochrome P450
MDTSQFQVPDHVPSGLVQVISFHDAPGMESDPTAVIDRLRDDRPIVWGIGARRGKDAWILKDYDVLFEAFQSPHLFSSNHFSGFSHLLGEDWLLIPPEVDPPAHGGYRRFLNKMFTPSKMNELEPKIAAIVRNLTDKVLPDGRCDFRAAVATPLPTIVFLGLVGLPVEDASQFLAWADPLMHSVDPQKVAWGARAVRDYMVEAMRERGRNPRDDIMSQIATAEIGDQPMSDTEKMAMAFNLYIAGLDTVTNALAASFLYLARDQALQAELRAKPELRAKAVEELLRTRVMVVNGRFVTQDMEFHGVQMKKGDRVALPTMFANRDPKHFADPGKIDLERNNTMSHIAFGTGIHNCLGSHLARRELKIVLDEWLDRVPPFAVPAGERPVTYGSSAVFGVEHLPLEW